METLAHCHLTSVPETVAASYRKRSRAAAEGFAGSSSDTPARGTAVTPERWPSNPTPAIGLKRGSRRLMHMTNHGLLVTILVGIIAGWLAGKVVRGVGFGIVGDLLVGIIGAFIGSWLLPRAGLHLGTGVVSAIVNAALGAIVLLLIVRLLGGAGRWGRWRRRW